MLRLLALCAALIPLALADSEFVIEDPTQQDVQVVHFKQQPSQSYYGYNNMGMPSPYSSRFYSPQMWNPMGMGMMGTGRTLEDYFRTFLNWMTPSQKAELRQMRSIGTSREMMVRRVMDFFEMLPMMSERRDRATMMMKMACHKMNEMVFGRSQAWNLKRIIENAAMSPRPFTSAQEVQEMIDEMTTQVDEFQKQRMINMYGPLCKRVTNSYIQMYPQQSAMMGANRRMMMGGSMMPFAQQQSPSSAFTSASSNFYFPYSLSSLYNTIQAMPFQGAGKYFANRFPFMKSMFYNNPSSGMGMMTSEQQQQQQMESEQQQQMTSSSFNNPMMTAASSSSSEEQQQQEMMSTGNTEQMQQQQQQQKPMMMTGTSGIDMGMMGMPSGAAGMTGYYKPKQQEMQQQQQTAGQQQQMGGNGQKGMQQQQQQQQPKQMVAIPENTAGIFPSYNNNNNNELFW